MRYIQLFLLTIFLLPSLHAHSLEPRSYSNAPVDLNFLVVGYSYSDGALPDIPELGLKDPKLRVDTAVLAYARVFGFHGQSGKIDVIVPFAKINGDAILNDGSVIYRETQGLGDSKIRLSYNFFGAKALSKQQYASYKQDLIIGASVQIGVPTGKYDTSRLVNISANRWSVKPAIGISKAIDDLIIECGADAEFYTANDEFNVVQRRQQDPIYSTQAHLIYNFKHNIWIAVDANYFWGGDYKIDGIYADKKLSDSRMGATFSMPIDKQNSIKIYGSSGISTRVGTNFDLFGVAWQFHWF